MAFQPALQVNNKAELSHCILQQIDNFTAQEFDYTFPSFSFTTRSVEKFIKPEVMRATLATLLLTIDLAQLCMVV